MKKDFNTNHIITDLLMFKDAETKTQGCISLSSYVICEYGSMWCNLKSGG
jgi:hypothetical protein